MKWNEEFIAGHLSWLSKLFPEFRVQDTGWKQELEAAKVMIPDLKSRKRFLPGDCQHIRSDDIPTSIVIGKRK